MISEGSFSLAGMPGFSKI